MDHYQPQLIADFILW